MGLVVEAAVRAGVAAVGLVEVAVGVLRGGRLVALLPLDGGPGEVPLGDPGGDLVADDRVGGRDADPDLAAAVTGRPVDRVGGDPGW